MKRETMTEHRCVSLSALCDVLNANCLTWFCARGFIQNQGQLPPVSEPHSLGRETLLDKVSPSLFIALVFLFFFFFL